LIKINAAQAARREANGAAGPRWQRSSAAVEPSLLGRCAIFLHRFRLFSLFGFEVSIDASWFLLAVLISWTLAGTVFPSVTPGLTTASYWLMAVLATGGLLMSIVFHETAHSLVARHYGMPIRGITLFIFGGVAEMTTEPSRPRDELLMAAAGPAASLLLAIILFLLFAGVVAWDGPASIATVFWYLALINFVLAVFNLVPAFPLDGGRMFRAALWSWRGDLDWATRIAAGAGSLFGTLLIVLGLIGVLQGDFIGGMWRFLIGMFLRGAASASYGETLARRILTDIPVTRVMNPDPIAVAPELSVQAFIDDYVYRFHHRWFPVVDNGMVVGSITTKQAATVDRSDWLAVPVGRIMRPLSRDDAVTPETTAFTALTQMRSTGQSRLMVLRNGALLGILSSRDLLEVLSLEQELHQRRGRAADQRAWQ
jgi:Zn-dependent protease/predicted transcriptional regulator